MFDIIECVFDNGSMTINLDHLPVTRGLAEDDGAAGHPVHPLLRPLFPGGLRPEVYSLQGASSVGLGLLVGGWCGVVGVPELGVEAAQQWGVDLSRLVLVPEPGGWLETVATLVEGLDVVLACAPGALPAGACQRLSARLRSQGSTLVVLGHWPKVGTRIEVRTVGWHGLGRGHGSLSAQDLEVTVTRHHRVRSLGLVHDARGIRRREEGEVEAGGVGEIPPMRRAG